MSCSSFDLKDYYFGELPEPARGHTEAHLASCATCRDELSALDLTRASLLALPDEEPPRRIAFVSDKVFEPNWWQRLWTSGPQLGFAAASVLALAIVLHGFLMRPEPVIATPVAATIPTEAIEAEVARRLPLEVARAVAASEERQIAKTMELVNAKLRDAKAEQRQTLLMVRDVFERVEKRNSMMRRVAYPYEP